jgi:hypothetical protein
VSYCAETKATDIIAAMDVEQIVAVLIQERDRLNAAIEALHRPTARKPMAVAETTRKTAKKRGWTAAQKKQQRERMRAYWAKKKKA